MNKYIAALAVDKVQTFLTEAIHSHVQEKETEEATLRGIINSSDQISKDFFKAIYAEFSEAEENTLMKCSGVFIFSSGRSEEELRERLNSLFVKYYKASQGQKILRYVCFPSEGLDEISAIKKAKMDLKQVKSMNGVIEKNKEILFAFAEPEKAEHRTYALDRKQKEFSMFAIELNALKIENRKEDTRFRIAVIKADLDGMGKMFREIDQYEDYKVISEILNREISLEGLNRAAKQFAPDERERWLFPLYIAGDDIFFAVAVEDLLRGVDVCRQLMKTVNREIEEKGIRDKKLGMSLGAEITFNKEPIRYYMERVEIQLNNAKKQTTPKEIEQFLIMKISAWGLTFFDIDYYAMKTYRESLKNDRENGRKKKAELSWQMQNVPIWSYFISDIKFLNYIRTTGGKCSELLGKPSFFYTLLKDVTDEEICSDDVKYINHVLYHLEPKYMEHSSYKLREAELILNSSLIRQLYMRDEDGFKIVLDRNTKQRFQTYLRLMILFCDIRFKLFKDRIENADDIFEKKKTDIRRILFSKPRQYLYEHCLKARSEKLTDVFVQKTSLADGKKVGYQKISLERSAFFRLKTVSLEKAVDIIELHNPIDKEEIEAVNQKRQDEGKLPNRLWFDSQKMIKEAVKSGMWTSDYVDSLMLFYSYNEMFMKMKK